MTLEVDFATLTQAGTVWKEQGDQLRAAAGGLDDIDATALGDRVAGAAAAYVEHWADRLRAMQATSEENGEALIGAAAGFVFSDEASTEGLTGLMIWQPGGRA